MTLLVRLFVGDILVNLNSKAVMRHLCHISLRGSPGILKILIVHGLDKGIQLIAGVLEHRTDLGQYMVAETGWQP